MENVVFLLKIHNSSENVVLKQQISEKLPPKPPLEHLHIYV